MAKQTNTKTYTAVRFLDDAVLRASVQLIREDGAHVLPNVMRGLRTTIHEAVKVGLGTLSKKAALAMTASAKTVAEEAAREAILKTWNPFGSRTLPGHVSAAVTRKVKTLVKDERQRGVHVLDTRPGRAANLAKRFSHLAF